MAIRYWTVKLQQQLWDHKKILLVSESVAPKGLVKCEKHSSAPQQVVMNTASAYTSLKTPDQNSELIQTSQSSLKQYWQSGQEKFLTCSLSINATNSFMLLQRSPSLVYKKKLTPTEHAILTSDFHATSGTKYLAAYSCCLHQCIITYWLPNYGIQLFERLNSSVQRQK